MEQYTDEDLSEYYDAGYSDAEAKFKYSPVELCKKIKSLQKKLSSATAKLKAIDDYVTKNCDPEQVIEISRILKNA